MKNHTLSFGLALVIIGIFGYSYYSPHSLTALIPAGFGLALLLTGFCSARQGCHKHAMHAAAMIALVGTIGAGVMAGKGLASGASTGDGGIDGSVLMQTLMALVCLVFVVLCIQSFKAARGGPASAGSDENDAGDDEPAPQEGEGTSQEVNEGDDEE